MTETGTLSELIESARKRQAECEPEAQHRKLHWSDIAIAFVALAILFGVSMHLSSRTPAQDQQPTILKWSQDR